MLVSKASDARLDTCVECPPNFYSLLPARRGGALQTDDTFQAAAGALCRACPPGARCPGGATVVPDAGHWLKPPVFSWHDASPQRQKRQEDSHKSSASQEGSSTLRRSDDAEESGEPARDPEREREAEQGAALVFRCPPSACLAGGECAQGRDPLAPVCGTCADDWAMSNGRCIRCGKEVRGLGISLYVTGGLLAVLACCASPSPSLCACEICVLHHP